MIKKITLVPIAAVIMFRKRFDIVGIIFNKIANKIYQNHPQMAKRLCPIIGKSFLINITNMPFNVFLLIKENGINVKALSKLEEIDAALYISSDIKSLIEIFEGDCDGDALFFSRKLQIKGNSQALVTLRNAIDSEEINLVDEISTLFWIFSNPVKKVIHKIKGHVR